MFRNFLKPTQRYAPPQGPPPSQYAPPPGPPPSLYAPPPGPPPSSGPPPPEYAPGTGQSHETSESNATLGDYEAGDQFCEMNKIWGARIFSTDYKDFGVEKWGLIQTKDLVPDETTETEMAPIPKAPGMTSISVQMDQSSEVNHRLVLLQLTPQTGRFKNRGDTCFTSNLPMIAGHYNTAAKRGSYFEITIRHMSGNGTIALGMQCLPYPPNRLPGWHRKSAALHFDDRRLFYEDSEGGQDYMKEIYDPKSGKTFPRHNVPQIKANDTIGCGYEFKLNGGVGHLFYTYNGELLPIAFRGIFDPMPLDKEVDVFAAVGVTDGPCQFDVNFGLEKFKWSGPSHSHRGTWNRDEWTVDGIFKQFGDGPPQYGS